MASPTGRTPVGPVAGAAAWPPARSPASRPPQNVGERRQLRVLGHQWPAQSGQPLDVLLRLLIASTLLLRREQFGGRWQEPPRRGRFPACRTARRAPRRRRSRGRSRVFAVPLLPESGPGLRDAAAVLVPGCRRCRPHLLNRRAFAPAGTLSSGTACPSSSSNSRRLPSAG